MSLPRNWRPPAPPSTRAQRRVRGFLYSLGMLVGLELQASWTLPVSDAATEPDFGTYWHDGKAEIDGYRMTIWRYGEKRPGKAVRVYVTEPFRLGARVKADDPTRDPRDVVDVLKLNFVRDFQTGIYDYHTMVSLFVGSDTFKPLKVTFSSAEWCGNVFEELLPDEHSMRHRLASYFEGESTADTLPRPAGGMLEEELDVSLRGLRGAFLAPGAKRRVPFLASAFYRRLMHQPAQWSSAEIKCAGTVLARVPAGEFPAIEYVVRPADGRVGRYWIETEYPHRILHWGWTPPLGVDPAHSVGAWDRGELTGTARLEYWKLHANGDERLLKQLGLAPLTPTPAK